MRCQGAPCAENCRQLSAWTPCLQRQDSGRSDSGQSFYGDNGGLVVSSIELGRILAEKGRANFRAYGICMYPSIKPGDKLHIVPKEIEDVCIGDIAVFRRSKNLYGHRTISKGRDERGAYVITKPDNSEWSKDDPSYEDDVLGIVSSIERKGSIFKPKERPSSLDRICFMQYLKFILAIQKTSSIALDIVSPMQKSVIYREVASRIFDSLQLKFSYIVQIPLNSSQMSNLYQMLSPEEFHRLHEKRREKDQVTMWSLLIFINDRQQPAAWASFIYRPKVCPFAGWWIRDLEVRIPYRGSGIEERLILKSQEILVHNGVTELWARLPNYHWAPEILFRNLGFREPDVCSELNEEPNSSPILRKILAG
jgi:hypothetical protein